MNKHVKTASDDRPVVLAVDDEETNLLLLKRPLKKEGFDLIPVSSGAEALEVMSSTRVDLVLLDWMMPVMNGLETLKKIKEREEWRHIPVIMVTARTESRDIAEGLECGASDYVKKPVDMVELISRVKAGLREYNLRKGLISSNERLLKLNSMKSNFLAIVSHDLRTPLHAIIGFSNMLLDGKVSELDTTVKKTIKIINKSATRLLALVDNLLDLAKIESGVIQLEIANRRISSILRECYDSMSVNAELKDIQLDIEIPSDEPAVKVDSSKMTRLINNLLSNAIKFTPKGGRVTASVVYGDNDFTIKIKDSGPGIPAEEMEHLFKKFSQLSAKPTAGEKGTGLGLVISKKIVDLHGGRIWIES